MSLVEILPKCHDRALKLLTTAAAPPPSPPPEPPPPEPQTRPDKLGHGTRTGRKTVAAADVGTVFAEIEKAVHESGAARVEIEWKVYSGEDDRTQQT